MIHQISETGWIHLTSASKTLRSVPEAGKNARHAKTASIRTARMIREYLSRHRQISHLKRPQPEFAVTKMNMYTETVQKPKGKVKRLCPRQLL